MLFNNFKEKARNTLERHIHWVVIMIMSLGVFVFIAIMNPQTLVWVGLAQLECDLPQHSKCVADNPLKKLFGLD